MTINAGYERLLRRVDIAVPVSSLVLDIANAFHLGDVVGYAPIEEGYQDLNIRVRTNTGEYVLKVFSREKPLRVIEGIIDTIAALRQLGVPILELVPCEGSSFLYRFQGHLQMSYACVSTFFNGLNFLDVKPTISDIDAYLDAMIALHRLPGRVERNFDPWGAEHLCKEYNRKSRYLGTAELALVKPVVEEFAALEFIGFRTSIIYEDPQLKHLLKDAHGRYCVIDFGCLDYSYSVLDLGIFLAYFALDLDKPACFDGIFRHVTDYYSRAIPLSTHEVASVWPIVRAAYAGLLLESRRVLRNSTEDRPELHDWVAFATTGLQRVRQQSHTYEYVS